MDTIAKFQERRAETWRRVRIPVIVMLAGFLVLFFFSEGVRPEPTLRFWISFIAFISVVGAVAYVTFTWKRLYRCPECEAPVQNSFLRGGDVPLNPDSCPNCGVRLR